MGRAVFLLAIAVASTPAAYPLPMAAGVLLFLQPSVPSVLLLLASGLIGILSANLSVNLSDIRNGHGARLDFRERRGGYDLLALDVTSHLTNDATAWISYRFAIVRKFLEKFHPNHQGFIEPLYVVLARPLSSLRKVPPALTTYCGINNPTVIFVYDDPSVSPVAMFQFFHELAHAGILAPTWATRRYRVDLWLLIALLTWIGAPPLCILLCTATVGVSLLARMLGVRRLTDEIRADSVALWSVFQITRSMSSVMLCSRMLARVASVEKANRNGRVFESTRRAARAAAYARALEMSPRPPALSAGRPLQSSLIVAALWVLAISGSPPTVTWWTIAIAGLVSVVMLAFLHLSLGFVFGAGDMLVYDLPRPKRG